MLHQHTCLVCFTRHISKKPEWLVSFHLANTMDASISTLTKKAFSLGKKYSQLKLDIKKLKDQQYLFFTSNSKITAEVAGHRSTEQFERELKDIDDIANSKWDHPDFVDQAEKKLNTFETKLIDKKIDFHMQLMEHGCCQHNVLITKPK